MKQGILLVNKPKGKTSFYLVKVLRKLTQVKKIGHAGTLDPLATGVMVLLIGKNYTKLASQFLKETKEYETRLLLGVKTDSFDMDGEIIAKSDIVPNLEDVKKALDQFQGTIKQTPPVFSAKKIQGQKACDLARKGISVKMEPVCVFVETTLLQYNYPHLDLHIKCSSGTYIRSIAEDIGNILKCGASVQDLKRTKSGDFALENCVSLEDICENPELITNNLQQA